MRDATGAMWVACNRARLPATWPRVFCELKIMKIGILIHQIIQEKFVYGEFFMLVMIGYIFIFRMVKKMQNSGFEIVAGLTLPLTQYTDQFESIKSMNMFPSFLILKNMSPCQMS